MPRGKATKSIQLIQAAYEILQETKPNSVRGVVYELFTAGIVPNTGPNVGSRVSKQLTWARENGLIPWEWIVDEHRGLEREPSWNDPAAYSRAVKDSYRRDRWTYQPQRVEVWSEKGTRRGVLGPVLDEWGVGFRVMHGFTSATEVRNVAQMTEHYRLPLLVLYVGDWDPSGLYMSEADLPGRLREYGANVEVRRIALTADDVRPGYLPSFPASDKRKDPRYKWFVQHFGHTCWELDALKATTLRDRVETTIRNTVGDWDIWDRCGRAEAAERASLVEIMSAWKVASA